MGDFYGTGIEIWARFWLVGIIEKKHIWADYDQLLRLVFSSFRGQKNEIKYNKNTKELQKIKLIFFLKE